MCCLLWTSIDFAKVGRLKNQKHAATMEDVALEAHERPDT